MKKLVSFLFSILFGFSVFGQNFGLEMISHNQDYAGFNNLFLLDGKIWASTMSNGPIYFDGATWHYINQPISQGTGRIHGIKKADGTAFVAHHTSAKGYVWNNTITNFDFFATAMTFVAKSFVLAENKIYVCTHKRTNDDNKAHLYLWDGASSGAKIAERQDVSFMDMYVKSENNVLILSENAVSQDVLSENKLLRYNGSELVDLYSFDLDRGSVTRIWSNDKNIFFILTYGGDVYRWDDSSSQMTKIYSYTSEDHWMFNSGIICTNNENVFIYGESGVKHIKVSTGESDVLYMDWNEPKVLSGYYDKYSNRALFCNLGGALFELTGLTSVDQIDISSKMAVYPNPAVDRLSINFPVRGQKSVAIYNVIGAQIMSSNFFEDNSEVDISALPTGMYILKVNTSEGIASKKFIKK